MWPTNPDDDTITETPNTAAVDRTSRNSETSSAFYFGYDSESDDGRFAPFTWIRARRFIFTCRKNIDSNVLPRGWAVEGAADPVDYLEILGTKAVVRESPPTRAPAKRHGLEDAPNSQASPGGGLFIRTTLR